MSTRSTRIRNRTRQATTSPASNASPRASSRTSTKATTSKSSTPRVKSPSGTALIGRVIEIEWPTGNSRKVEYYQALVIGYTARRKEHKVIYLDEESIEALELDEGTRNRRRWRDISEAPDDAMIGSMLKFVDNETGVENNESWFDFMRQHPNRNSTPFYVFVVSKVEDPDPEEVSGPRNSGLSAVPQENNLFYRVIHAPNEYLTTVDLSCIEYNTHQTLHLPSKLLPQQQALPTYENTDSPQETGEEEEQVIVEEVEEVAGHEPTETRKTDTRVEEYHDLPVEEEHGPEQEQESESAQEPEQDTEEENVNDANLRSRVRSAPSKSVDVIPDDENLPETLYPGDAGNTMGGVDVDVDVDADVDPHLDMTKDFDSSPIRTAIPSRRRRGSPLDDRESTQPSLKLRRQEAHGDEAEADEVEEQKGRSNTKGNRTSVDGESSPGTVDTREDPIESANAKNNGNDSESNSLPSRRLVTIDDDESKDMKEVSLVDEGRESNEDEAEETNTIQSKVGDYVSVNVGNEWRKAYVEAYFTTLGTHFLAFVDERGGNVQLKLTSANHTLLDDKQAASLTRNQARSKVEAAPVVDLDDVFNGHTNRMNDEDDVIKPRRVPKDDRPMTMDDEDRKPNRSSNRATVELLDVDNDDDDGEYEPQESVDDGRRRSSRARPTGTRVKRERSSTVVKPKKKVSNRQRNRWALTGGSSKSGKSKRAAGLKILGKSAGGEILSRCITVVWPNTKLVYVALVIGYAAEGKQHMLLYMVDHCVEILELKYREWELLPRGQEPWNSSGMVGKRVFVWWTGEYNSMEAQRKAIQVFGSEEKTRVAYEAYVLSYIGKGIYKIVYPCNEDCEERELQADRTDGDSPLDKEWDILPEGINDVMGLPVIGWEG